MAARKTEVWMLSEAREMLRRAEGLRVSFFALREGSRVPTWEPPADVVETATELVVIIALPGVDASRAEAAIDGGDLVVVGMRRLPEALRNARIHRMELPHGRFERRIPLPPGRYGGVQREAADGCLIIRLRKSP
jgi:HSP20 family protein